MSAKISSPIKRVDADDKSRGTARYIADLSFEGMLYARTVRADRPRARILSVEIPSLPDGYYVVDRRDAPATNRCRVLVDDWPFFAEDVVNHIGEPIGLLVGPDREILDALVSRVVVHYEGLDPILSLEEAESGRKPPIFGEDDCFAAYALEKGDPDDAFARAARVVEGDYHTGLQEHIYMEPQGLVATAEAGKVTIYGSMQCPYYIKKALVEALGCEPGQVRVVQTATGGAFGGKEEYPSLIAGHVAFAALKTGRPVRLIFDRGEDIRASTKRHPSRFHYRTALDANGRILGMEVDVRLDGGAYAGLSSVVLQRAMFAATGVYHVENLRVRGKVLATNTAPTGAFRGFGAPQAFFAVEMHVAQIARDLGLDPLDFKMAHAYKKGDRTATMGLMRQEIKLPEIVARLEEMSGYRRKQAEFARDRGRVRRGIGVSLFLHGCGFTGDGEQAIIKARAKLVKRPDGRVEILVANVEMGQGAATALRKIVAHALALPMERVIFENPDTDRVPDSGPTVASRTVMIVGGLLARAAQELEKRWDEGDEVEVVKAYEHPAGVEWDQKALKGDAYPSYAWGANVVEVEVDTLTLEVTVRGAWGVYDVGVPIDEQLVRGQIEGGLVQGLGYATIEVMNLRNGHILQSSLTDYVIPTSKDVPEIESDLVLNPYEGGPFGAKGAGEMPLVGAAPALAAAVQQALGVPICSIPVTPEYLLQEISRNDSISR